MAYWIVSYYKDKLPIVNTVKIYGHCEKCVMSAFRLLHKEEDGFKAFRASRA